MKGDHFVGKYYVRFAVWEKEAYAEYQKGGGTLSEEDWRKTPGTPDSQAQTMLEQWEKGDPEVLRLWTLMNTWTLDGLSESYKTMGISFDTYYYESNTYKLGKSEVLKGVEQGVFYREQDGSVWVDLAPIGLDKKVLLRKDGTSLYMCRLREPTGSGCFSCPVRLMRVCIHTMKVANCWWMIVNSFVAVCRLRRTRRWTCRKDIR